MRSVSDDPAVLGAAEPLSDAEAIACGWHIQQELGIAFDYDALHGSMKLGQILLDEVQRRARRAEGSRDSCCPRVCIGLGCMFAQDRVDLVRCK